MKDSSFTELERILETRPLTADVRRGIRRARIAFVDDQLDELQGLVQGIRDEGFTNIVEFREVQSVNDLIQGDFDLVILDLVGVATTLTEADGVGVLAALKRTDPSLPVLVLSGNAVTPTLATALAEADIIRNKPMLPVDLAVEIEDLLKSRMDTFWSALAVLRELRALAPDRMEKLTFLQRAQLWFTATRLAGDIEKQNPKAISRIIRIASLVSGIGANAMRLIGISRRLSSGT